MNNKVPAQFFIDTCRAAGAEVMRLRPHILEHITALKAGTAQPDHTLYEIKPDGSPVTAADLAAHRIIADAIQRDYPGIAVVSEEGEKTANKVALQQAVRFETDPVDNTGGLVGGYDKFSVNLGLVVDGVPVKGAIFFPYVDGVEGGELYYVGDDGKAYCQIGDKPPRQIIAHRGELPEPLRVVAGFGEVDMGFLGGRKHAITRDAGQHRTMQIAARKAEISSRYPGGDAGFDSWDIVGPQAVLEAAGGMIVDMSGNPLRFNSGTTKLPDHIAGSRDALIALGISTRQQLPPNSRAKG